MFSRKLSEILPEYAKFPAIAILGPRQSGKTTLAQQAFPKHTYLSFEDEAIRNMAQSDPWFFFNHHENKHGLILDEFQYVPNILSYIQLIADEKKRPGYFILSGSQNFLVNQAITQSLAGRVGIVNLFPFSLQECIDNKIVGDQTTIDAMIFKGFYPRIYQEGIAAPNFYSSYINTYVEKDVRQLVNIGDFYNFQKFTALCAGRVGQLVNFEALGDECGISNKTVKSWLSLLEASYIIFLLQPHYVKFNMRVIKTPKLYFYDTGLACSLLRIPTQESIAFYPLRGALFENLIIADLYKQYCNIGQRPPLYFWRDKNGSNKVDCIIDQGIYLTPIEIKSGQTVKPEFFKGLTFWNELNEIKEPRGYVVYGGELAHARSIGNIIGWKEAANLIERLCKTLPGVSQS